MKDQTLQLLIATAFYIFGSNIVVAQTYTTIANGNWNNAATWQGGIIPPNMNPLPNGATVNIRHTVNFNIGGNIGINGTMRIQPFAGSTARLNVPTGINVEIYSTGRFYIFDGSYVQYRFVPGNDGEPYSGNTPGAAIQSGTFKNIGGFIECRNFYVEIAQDWTNESNGTRIYRNGCIYTGQNFSLSGSGSIDTLININLSIGWHASGNYQLNDGFTYYQGFRCQIAGTSGNFSLNSGSVAGDIDYIFLRNQIVPFNGGGLIFASGSVTGNVNLDAYCSVGGYTSNGKFTGLQTNNCALNYFPGNCPSGGSPPQPLPITLASFSGIANECNAVLQWKTSAEQNADKFIIEQSMNGLSFVPVAESKSANNPIGFSYQMPVPQPNSIRYYRLKMMDKDGKFSYSPIIMVRTNCGSTDYMTVFPSPVSANVTVSFQTAYKGQATLQVMNAVGQQLAGIKIQVSSTVNTINLDMSNYVPGLYLLSLLNEQGNKIGEVQKVVKN